MLGVFAGELLWLIGVVELVDTAYRVVVDVVALISFVLLALTPWLLRNRIARDEEAG